MTKISFYIKHPRFSDELTQSNGATLLHCMGRRDFHGFYESPASLHHPRDAFSQFSEISGFVHNKVIYAPTDIVLTPPTKEEIQKAERKARREWLVDELKEKYSEEDIDLLLNGVK